MCQANDVMGRRSNNEERIARVEQQAFGRIPPSRLWAIADRTKLRAQGREVLATIITSPPVRAVSGRGGNVRGLYPSRKMGCSVQYESRTCELFAIRIYELDAKVVAYCEQPFRMLLSVTGSKRRHKVPYTPDFFVVRDSGFTFVEAKPEESLARLVERFPFKWERNNGKYRFPAAEQWARDHGFGFEVLCPADYPRAYRANLEYLDGDLRSDHVVPDSVRRRIAKLVHANPGCTMQRLASLAAVSVDAIRLLIARGTLFCDLESQLLAEPARCQVFVGHEHHQCYSSAAAKDLPPSGVIEMIRPGTLIEWDAQRWTVLTIGDTMALLQRENAETFELPIKQIEERLASGRARCVDDKASLKCDSPAMLALGAATPKEIEAATNRLEILLGKRTANVSQRTIYNWRARYRVAETSLGLGIVGLLPKYHLQGPRGPVKADLYAKTVELIDVKHLVPSQPVTESSYRLIADELERLGFDPPSGKTFRKWLHTIPKKKRIRARLGAKAAYSSDGFCWFLDREAPVHGLHPWHVMYIDHTEIDLQIVDEETGKVLGRLWLSLAIDGWSRRLVGYWLTFNKPSYASVMCLMRDVVWRHGRLPLIVVNDNGREFDSVAYDFLLMAYKVEKRVRPPSKSRFGTLVERIFHTSHSEFVYNLTGNTQAAKEVRTVTPDTDPERLAVWTTSAFWCAFEKYVKAYEVTTHGTLGESPLARYRRGMAQSERPMRLVKDKDAFAILSLPPIPRKQAQVDNGMGVTVHYIQYYHPSLANPALSGKKVDVRYDPSDVRHVYARVEGTWQRCVWSYSRHEPKLNRPFSLKELKAVTTELRKRLSRSKGISRSIDRREVLEAVKEAKGQEIELLAAREAAVARAYTRLRNGPDSKPTPAPAPSPTTNGDAKRNGALKTRLAQLSKTYTPELLPLEKIR